MEGVTSGFPMPLMKANEVLELVIDYQRDIFTVDIIDRMEEYHRKIEHRKVTDKVIDQAQRESVETIEQLCRITDSFPANSFFQTVPDRMRLAISLRFQYFEKILRPYGDAVLGRPPE